MAVSGVPSQGLWTALTHAQNAVVLTDRSHTYAPDGQLESLLDIAIAQSKPEAEPDGMLDDRGREPMTGARNPAHAGP